MTSVSNLAFTLTPSSSAVIRLAVSEKVTPKNKLKKEKNGYRGALPYSQRTAPIIRRQKTKRRRTSAKFWLIAMSLDGRTARILAANLERSVLTPITSLRRDWDLWTQRKATFRVMVLDEQLGMELTLELKQGLLFEN